VYSLDSTVVTDKQSFLGELSRRLGIASVKKWDAAADLLWQQLMEQTAKRVAVVWENADAMFDGRLQLLFDCIEFLSDVGRIAERQEVTVDNHPVLLRIVLFGNGDNFVAWGGEEATGDRP
jgi:hypothetical protein